MQGRARTVAAALLEREAEVERLDRAIAAAVAEAGSVVAIEGEAGIGKTSLLAHATAAAARAGLRVLTARGGELERSFAYGVVRQLFETELAAADGADRERWLAGAAALAAPVLTASAAAGGSGPDPSSVQHGLYWLAANLACERPLLVAIDDAHWADDASIAFLSYLARRVDELAIVVVYASRMGEGASDELPAVTQPELTDEVLRPAALSPPAAAELVRWHLARPGGEQFAGACHAATNGNPFLLRELLRALEADGIDPDDASAGRVAQIAPKAIARATLGRLRRLGAAARELAFAVAVLGRSAELRHSAALAGLDGDAAAQTADALTAAAILRDARPLEFIHPIVRTTIYNEIAPGARALRHKRAARLLADEGADAAQVAPHLLAAEPAGDPWVVERLRVAARDVLQRGAPEAACAYLERALAEPPPPADRLDVLLALGSAELHVARPTAVAHLREVVEDATDAQMRFEATQELVWALAFVDRVQEGVAVGHTVLDDVPAEETELRLRLSGWLVATAQFAPQIAKRELDGLAHYAGTLTGATVGERQILALLAFAAAHRGDSVDETVELARLALAGDRLLREHRPGAPAPALGVWALVYADELAEAERCFDVVIEEARRAGWRTGFGTAMGCRCQVLVRQGRLAEAEAEVTEMLSAGQLNAMARAMLLAALMHTMVERSDPRDSDAFLREHGLDGDLWDTAMAGMLLLSRGQLRLAAGDARAALADFEQLARRDALSGLDTPAMPSRACRALAHLQLGERDAARALAAEELARARRWKTPSALALALRSAALVEDGYWRVELLRDSIKAAGESAPYERALSLTELGAALRRAGHPGGARDTLRQALDLADRCGARRLAARAHDALVATGARPRRAALSGPDALTPSERRVAQLAADGLTNREIAQALFVTIRTVEGHLTQTYSKLDVASREQLAAALAPPGD